MAELRARRMRAREYTRSRRIDLAIALGAAIILLLASPGLAITLLVAGTLLPVGLLLMFLGRRARQRRERRAIPTEPNGARSGLDGSAMHGDGRAAASMRAEHDLG